MTTSIQNQPSGTLRTTLAAALALLAAALLLAACGSGENEDGVDPGTDPPDFSKAVDAAPKELAPLYADGAALVGGGEDAYNAQLAEAKGYPLVVNKWASWCGPCRVEFPYFQDQAAERANEIGFIGINAGDTDPAAETFLRDHPIPVSELHGSGPGPLIVHRCGAGAAGHDLLQRRRREDLHAFGALRLRGRVGRRHRQVRGQRLSS